MRPAVRCLSPYRKFATQPGREALARIDGKNCSIDLLIDDICEELRGRPYDLVAGGWRHLTRQALCRAIRTAVGGNECAVDLTQSDVLVRSVLPSITEKRCCPDPIFVPPRFDVYRAVSAQIREYCVQRRCKRRDASAFLERYRTNLAALTTERQPEIDALSRKLARQYRAIANLRDWETISCQLAVTEKFATQPRKLLHFYKAGTSGGLSTTFRGVDRSGRSGT